MEMSPAFQLADKACRGRLESQLRRWRAEGRTFRAIAETLRERGVRVSHNGVMRWCRRLDIP